jgi:hypothetical protein
MGAPPTVDNLDDHALREAEALCQVVEDISAELELPPLLKCEPGGLKIREDVGAGWRIVLFRQCPYGSG